MNRIPISISTLLVTLLMLAGCAASIGEGPMPALQVNQSGNSGGMIRMNSVAILDRDLQKWVVHQENEISATNEAAKSGKIALESTGARRSQTGTIEAWALLRNRTNKPLHIEGRVQFFDKSQAPLEGPTAWQRIILPPNSISAYREFSTDALNVSFYYIEIREGQ